MTVFQERALFIAALWLVAVAVRFQRSRIVLLGGLVALGLYAFVALLAGQLSLSELGMNSPIAWVPTLGWAVAWLALMLAWSPVADRLATRLVDKPPTLGAFRALQESAVKLLAGIVVAWVLGAFLEELIFRGIILRAVESALSGRMGQASASAIAILVAALGAGIIHLYQGPRAAIIIVQLSVLFGVLFVVSGHNLWTVMLCHGLYDTVAFIRFANKSSRYAQFAENE
jgi:membrane protease YdiL (CAAX protease family)